MKRKWYASILTAAVLPALVLAGGISARAAGVSADAQSFQTAVTARVTATGSYSNWEGVSNVSQFKDPQGNFCFALQATTPGQLSVYSISNQVKEPVAVLAVDTAEAVGAVTEDSAGNYYVVTGKANTGSDTSVQTLFIAKYDHSGNLVKKIGSNGGSNLNSVTPASFHTQQPFRSGNCDVAVSGNTLTVNYARSMYNGHQSNSILTINTDTMKDITPVGVYSSHSFGQRVIPYRNGFLYADQGDAYKRAFTINYTVGQRVVTPSADIFHFWVRQNALNEGDMSAVNNTFSQMGDLVNIDNSRAAFAATSAPSLSSAATGENQQLFIQIFDPEKNLHTAGAYITQGTRSGIGGGNGNENVTDYGVKWLTNETDTDISNPQLVYDGNGHLIVLFQQNHATYTGGTSYMGVYYMILDTNGNVLQDKTLYDASAMLNPCETPVYSNGLVMWAGNQLDSYYDAAYDYAYHQVGGSIVLYTLSVTG